MSLSCDCNSDYTGDGWFWTKYIHVTMPVGIRKRCCSCSELIDVASDAIEFKRYRNSKTDIEWLIYDEFVPLSSKFMCEPCSGLFLALDELGYCVGLGDNMRELVSEYNELRRIV